MSLKPHIIQPIPEETARVARAAFPHGSPYLTFRDALGTIFQEEDFAALSPSSGQPGLPSWRLALVTIIQFREQLSDRQAAEAVRTCIDWKYLLGLELSDPVAISPCSASFGTACSPAVRTHGCWTNCWSDAVP
jgi:transposase